ncbi:MAG TPA: FtsX-like permease family protein [Jatrophihabitans sp.]|jgi:hypothetical protein|uniref:ABC transporter permease n=1 Tax=Jatrophihabitans sp. TaxID=1932789 RepID=UPI002E0C1D5C|nr:FtsX-like permease family protein [Jatrophihabitans sp.]
MIRLGLRLTLGGGREAAARLVMIAVAVAVGTVLLLTTLAGLNAVNRQNARYAWLETGFATPTHTSVRATTDPVWWRLRADYFRGAEIGRVDVAATGARSPVPPGLDRLPGPGQYYASPALADLLRRTPAAELGDRYPGTQVGTIGAAALPAPDSLVIVVGRTVADLSHDRGARRVEHISTTRPGDCSGGCALGIGINSRGLTLILSVVVAGLLFPVLIFIGSATRLSAARREQRFAAMRLVGATPRQISILSSVESSVATLVGVAAGFGLFFLLRPALAGIPFTGARFFTGDLLPTGPDVLLVALGIPIAAAVAARIALRRVTVSPLGVTRRVTPRPPRAWRVVPLLVGLGELGYFAYVHDIGAATHADVNTEVAAFLSGILLTMIGLVVAGPWFTRMGSRALAGRATRPASLIAGRRLADNPQACFRAVSGLVLAVFVGTCALGVITTIVAYDGGGAGATAGSTGTLIDQIRPYPDPGPVLTAGDAATLATLGAETGVTGVAPIHYLEDRQAQVPPGSSPPTIFYVSCAQLAPIPAMGRCPVGARSVTIFPDYGGAVAGRASTMSATVWPAAALSDAQVQRLPVDTIAVGTDGSTAAVERVRTLLDSAYPETFAAETLSEMRADGARKLNSYKRLADVIILTSLPIAGCSLAVSVAGGLAERKRPFSLLRLAGAPLGVLRRVVGLEAAVPLLLSAVVSGATGLLAAHLFLRAQLHETLRPLGPEYYVITAAGLLASLVVIASTFPLLRRMTGPEAARLE